MSQLAKLVLMCLCGSILIIPVTARSATPEAPAPADSAASHQTFMVLAQAGSSGGTIGKRGRSVSGSEPEAETRSPGTRSRSLRPSGSRETRTRETRRHVRTRGSSHVRARGNCVSGSFAGYSGTVCY